MPPVIRIALVPHDYGLGEVVLRAYECLRIAGIVPVGYATGKQPWIALKANNREKAYAALSAGGFDFKEL